MRNAVPTGDGCTITKRRVVRAWTIAINRAKARKKKELFQSEKFMNFACYFMPYCQDKLWFSTEVARAQEYARNNP